MQLVYLTQFIVQINKAIDTQKYPDIKIDEIQQHIDKEDLFPYLEQRLGEDIDLSWFNALKVSGDLNVGLKNILQACGNDVIRKWGVKNSGLCLLLACTVELLRQEYLDKTPKFIPGSLGLTRPR